MTRPTQSAEAPPRPQRRPGLIACGLVSAAIALFMLRLSMVMIVTAITHGSFVRDQLEILDFQTRGKSESASGRITSSGEHVSIAGRAIMTREQALELENAGTLQGHREPVYYFPDRSGFWSAVDFIAPFRVQAVDQFEMGVSPVLLGVNVMLGVLAALCLRRGLRPRGVP